MALGYLIVEFLVYLIGFTVLAIHLIRIDPVKPWMCFFATTTMAVISVPFYFSQPWESTPESFSEDWNDPINNSLLLLTLAYMIADLPILLYFGKAGLFERSLFLIHHTTSAIDLICSAYYGRYQRFNLLCVTSEISNIFLNGRQILPAGSVLARVADVLFVIGFLGYRIGYQLPLILRFIYHLAEGKLWFDLFVMNGATIFVGLLHIYWTYLVLAGCKEVLFPTRVDKKSVKE